MSKKSSWKLFGTNSLDKIYTKEQWSEHKDRMFKMTQMLDRMETNKPKKNKEKTKESS